jgi:putative transposase
MPRPRRLEPAGVSLHVVQRGNNRASCFFSDVDRRFYLNCLRHYAERRECAIHAYVLMTNHVHLLVTPKRDGGVSLLMQDLGRRYVRTVNEAQTRTGTLWEGRFKSNLIDSETYLLACHRYIELNPVRAGSVAHPEDYPWSSHRHYASGETSQLISEHAVFLRLGKTPEQRSSEFLAMFQGSQSDHELSALRHSLNKGWALGSEDFLDRMEVVLGRSVRPPRLGRPAKHPSGRSEDFLPQDKMLF